MGLSVVINETWYNALSKATKAVVGIETSENAEANC